MAAALIYGVALAASGAPVESFLHARGQDIVNEQGEKVLLRGVGLGNWLMPEGYMWKFGSGGDRPRRIEKIVSDLVGPTNASRFWSEFRRNYITEADVRRIAGLGFNSVRPALNSRWLLTASEPPELIEEGFQHLDNLVRWCKGQGIYVILDMHAAPGGQTGQNIDDSANDQPELFMERRHQDELVALWTAIARRYRDEPAIAGFDLLNEPLPERTGAAAKFKDQIEPLYRRLTRAIREVDSKHMIILEGIDWANDWSVFTGPFDSNLVYQFHYYCWDTPAKLKSIDRFLDYRQRFKVPIWVGETGERDAAIYWATTEYFEANNIGWSFWPWKKMEADNAPYSIKCPQNWEAVADYSRGGAKLPAALAQKAFDQLLVNIRLENCVYHPEVVNATLRRVPARIEAENFGHGGLDVSYRVQDATHRSGFYRLDEPVRILAGESQRPRSDQYITLKATEWTAYTIHSDAREACTISLKARAPAAPAEAELLIGGRTLPVTITARNWMEIQLGSVPFSRDANRLQWIVTRGTVDLDWFEVKPAGTAQSSVRIQPGAAAPD